MINEYESLTEKSKAQSSKNDDAIAALEEQISAQKKSINEERFLWILALMIFFDLPYFSQSPNWGAPVAILILELIGLVIAANKLGIEHIVRLFDKIILLLSNSQK